jgi:hypothetical protein
MLWRIPLIHRLTLHRCCNTCRKDMAEAQLSTSVETHKSCLERRELSSPLDAKEIQGLSAIARGPIRFLQIYPVVAFDIDVEIPVFKFTRVARPHHVHPSDTSVQRALNLLFSQHCPSQEHDFPIRGYVMLLSGHQKGKVKPYIKMHK